MLIMNSNWTIKRQIGLYSENICSREGRPVMVAIIITIIIIRSGSSIGGGAIISSRAGRDSAQIGRVEWIWARMCFVGAANWATVCSASSATTSARIEFCRRINKLRTCRPRPALLFSPGRRPLGRRADRKSGQSGA